MGLFTKLPQSIVYFSRLYRVTVVNESGIVHGKLVDLFVEFEDVYPAVLAVQFYDRGHYFYVDWKDLLSFSYEKIVIKDSNTIRLGKNYFRTYDYDNDDKKQPQRLLFDTVEKTGPLEYPGLAKLVLDKQIVDIHGKKVVRVNDIHFVKVGNILRVTYADIGFRGMVRRLGFEAVLDFLKEEVISWKYVHTIPDRNIKKNLQLKISNEDILNIHPADLADILEDLNSQSRKGLFGQLDPELQALTLSEIDPDKQVALIDNAGPEMAAKIIENMDPDEAADILSELADADVDEIISQIGDNEVQEEIQELLDYDEDCAGGIMSTEVFSVFSTENKESLLNKIVEEHQNFESIYDIYVVDEKQRLIGTCTLHELLIHKENVVIADIMEKDDIKFLKPNDHWKKIAQIMSKYDLINVPIVDDEHELLGIVSIDDILPWALDE